MTSAQQAARPPAVIPVTELGTLGDNLGNNNGESRRVCLVPGFPAWIYKEYRAKLSGADVQRLDRLIGLPESMVKPDRDLARSHASWPASRVVNGQGSVGVLIPLAPDSYKADLETRPGRTKSKMLEVDLLAQPEDQQVKLKLPAQSLGDRISVCASIARVGALLERHGLVYLDWSYANVFWCWRDHSAFIIDMDGCSFGRRPQIETPNWADPLVPRGRKAGNETDRYRLALLIARCLTSERGDPLKARTALNSLRMHSESVEKAVEVLIRALSARTAAERPSMADMSAALDVADGLPASSRSGAGGVTHWKAVNRPKPTGTGAGRTATGSKRVPGTTKPAPDVVTVSANPAGPTGSARPGAGATRPSATASYARQPVKPSGGTATAVVWLSLFLLAALIVTLVLVL